MGGEGHDRNFQSHCGAIGAVLNGDGIAPNLRFQSHCGAIGARRPRVNRLALSVLSIPLWCDWGQPQIQALASLLRLSIPLWCDWGPSPPLPPPYSLHFQSHCGAIGAQLGRRACPPKSLLSIPLWCDWGLRCSTCHDLELHLSIPLWCDWGIIQIVTSLIRGDLSIPLWCDWGHPLQQQHLVVTTLSIPLWCDWGTAGPVSSGKPNSGSTAK